jgi:hypothetical protein
MMNRQCGEARADSLGFVETCLKYECFTSSREWLRVDLRR